MKDILLHEISHILAFHPYFFQVFKMNQTIDSVPNIVSSNALAKAREHFGDSTLSGIPLESQGGKGSVGSHWEARYMLGDIMISNEYPDSIISDITLGLFEDTGFYKVNYYSGGLFKFGKNEGSKFFNTTCIENEKAAFDEFCDVQGKAMCSSSRAVKSKCYIANYNNIEEQYRYFRDSTKGGFPPADYCPVAYEPHDSNSYFSKHCGVGTATLSNYGEKIGENSFCFMSSLYQSSVTPLTSEVPICYEIECDTSNKQIKVKIGSSTVTCPTEGGTQTDPSGLKGSIECPAYSELCTSSDGILCNEMFTCFTKSANNDGYNYRTTYSDYTGAAAVLDDDDDDGDAEYVPTIRRSSSFNFKVNFALLLAFSLIMI